ncbi:MAG: 16S rRNA (guanine(527)-N(7))-methyltransferase RsmG [Rhodobacteraceae bacterium]|nr:16S rRNA (guanine(527)-N(7))-methyltransferase RsmG [Paracoccaceae bacterium]
MMDSSSIHLCGQNVSRETFERLELFEALLKKWNGSINLVSKNSLDDIWERHIADSIQVFRLSGSARSWLDVGSGGGLPGAIVAILAMDECPEMKVTLIESDKRKSVFLRTVAREIGATFNVITDRIESAEPQKVDVMSARAVANLSVLLKFAERHLDANGFCLFSKGTSWKKEVDVALQKWNMDMEIIPSLTESTAVILKIGGISRV